MAKVLFSIQYEIKPEKLDDYSTVIRELKLQLKSQEIESYSVYEVKGKKNHFQEIYTFSSEEAYEQFDDDQNERINLLINKLNEMTVDNSTKYTTLIEATEPVAKEE